MCSNGNHNIYNNALNLFYFQFVHEYSAKTYEKYQLIQAKPSETAK